MKTSDLMILEDKKSHRNFRKRSRIVGTFLCLLFTCSCAVDDSQTIPPESDNPAHRAYFNLRGNAQGTTYQIKYKDAMGRNLQSKLDSLLADFDWHVSTYMDTSILSDFNNSNVEYYCQIVSPILAECFSRSKKVYENTDHAFNPAVYPLVDFWGFYDLNEVHRRPSQDQLDSILDIVTLDSAGVSLRVKMLDDGTEVCQLCKTDSRLKLDFNAIAQGYAVDLLALFLKNKGIDNYMVELGGEVKCNGINPDGNTWKIGIDSPIEQVETPERKLHATVVLSNQAMATSGNYRKFYEADGKKYSHTIDPRTGRPVEHSLLSATVVCEDAILADAYATAFMVFGVEKTKTFLKDYPELGVYLIYSDDQGGYRSWVSRSMEEILVELK